MITVDITFTCDGCGRSKKKHKVSGDPEDLIGDAEQLFYPNGNMTFAEGKIFCSRECYGKYLLKHGRKEEYDKMCNAHPYA